jgi:hypothetical protein
MIARRILQSLAQLTEAKNLRRQRPPQAGAIHGLDLTREFPPHRIHHRGRQHYAIDARAERVDERAQVGAAQARSRGIMHQHPILLLRPRLQKLESVHHRVLAMGAAQSGQQLG